METTRHHFLDALRAFAMLLGIFLHGLISFIEMPIWPAQDIRQNTAVYEFMMDAIHGFRMPLFFLISGFFTMMVWKRRGAGALTKQRAIRILVPLVIFTILMTPIMWTIGAWGGVTKERNRQARESTEERTEVELPPAETSSTIELAERGDIDALREALDAGADPNEREPFGGSALLGIAAIYDNVEAIELLLERGAEINERSNDASTPLHMAAFFGSLDSAKALVEHNADLNPRNDYGATPLSNAESDWGTVVWVVETFKIEVDLEEVKAGRPKVAEFLRSHGAEGGGGGGSLKPIIQFGAFMPVFHHLWFLYYLLWLAAFFMLFAAIARGLKIPQLPNVFVSTPWCLLWVVPLTFAAQHHMIQSFGPDTATGILLWPPKFLYYAIFFTYGVLCYGRETWILRTGRFWPIWLIIAVAALIFGVDAKGARGAQFQPAHNIMCACAAVYVWSMFIALFGIFRRWLDTENHAIRYVSDASYWLYIMHLPIIMALQVAISEYDIPSYLKLAFVCIAPTAVLMLCYAGFVRYTFIGTMLNGKKTRPQKS
ncbi:MAG: acyltransferase family protein [Verrucomicrobiota bacterium]